MKGIFLDIDGVLSGIILSVERGPKNKLKVVTEDYDFE